MRWPRAGREIVIGSRKPEAAAEVPSAEVEGLGNEEALAEGQPLVDCTVPIVVAVSGKATRTLGVRQGSAAQQAQEMVPGGDHW